MRAGERLIQSVYIHIPFCQQICHYCDFTKFFYDEGMASQYVEALIQEMNSNVPGSHHKVRTIFIGGGTPTALSLTQMETLLIAIRKKFDVDNCEEFTIEANPGDFAPDKIKLLREYGVNRISLGVQVFDDNMLLELGRSHKVKDVYSTIDQLKMHGFDNISIDLIYALPNQTVNHFRKTVEEAISFNLPHYSSYSLQIEPKTIFYNRYKKGQLHRPEQEEEVNMYEVLKQTMKNSGLQQYEISNFAKPGYESKHNLTYWNNEYYYGFGAGASGYLPGKRTTNIRPLPAYIKQAMQDGKPLLRVEPIGLKERIEEELFLGLRKREGINKHHFIEKFGFSYNELYKETIAMLIEKGWLMETTNHLRLTDKGLLFGNDVFSQFLLEEKDIEHVH